MNSPTLRAVLLLLAVLAAAPAAAQSIAAGQATYNDICRGCHGFPPLGGPERAANNPTLIATALRTVPAMQPFNFLSSAQIQDVAAYLGSIIAPPPPTRPAFNYTDLWWNPAESGWGLNLIQHDSDIVFGVMYTYESPGRPAWFVLPSGAWTTAFSYAGDLYRVTGPSAADATFDPNLRQIVKVGTGTLSFSDANNGTWTFSVNGQAVTKSITRQPF
jgi:cytochrome c553